MEQQYSAGIIVFSVKNKIRYYLLLHYIGGHWDFAKGKLEGSESKQEAAARELTEETGLSAQLVPGFAQTFNYKFRERNGKHIAKEVTLFIGQTEQQEITLSREHQGYKWLTYEQALAKLTYPNAQHILYMAHEFLNRTQY